MRVVTVGKIKQLHPFTLIVSGFLKGQWLREITFSENKITIKLNDVVIIDGEIESIQNSSANLKVHKIKVLEDFCD
ncbi:MAG: hypothetical protein Fur0010_02370 [Bdellovibrio sp.]